jgi:hypothetical protein
LTAVKTPSFSKKPNRLSTDDAPKERNRALKGAGAIYALPVNTRPIILFCRWQRRVA